MLRRADRALLMAKAKGRNMVVQLGSGGGEEAARGRRAPGLRGHAPPTAGSRPSGTPVPLQMAIEKLRGFVADHRAAILKIDGNQVQLEITEKDASRLRRLTDRPVSFRLNLRFEEQRLQKQESEYAGHLIRTKIHVAISPRKERDRRRATSCDRARQVLTSFRAYLMATTEDEMVVPSRGTVGAGEADSGPLAGMAEVERLSRGQLGGARYGHGAMAVTGPLTPSPPPLSRRERGDCFSRPLPGGQAATIMTAMAVINAAGAAEG